MSPSISLMTQYQALLAKGELRPDPAQIEAVGILQKLSDRLDGYNPAAARGILAKMLTTAPPQQGLYLYGDVGRGKSMLMDLFFECAHVEKKRRVHFHQFMLEVQARLHLLLSGPANVDGMLPQLARDMADEASLLCFDEFHVSNIADAMILGRLFGALFDNGVIIVATSNWPPDDLYKNGLQRDRFLPFIDLIKQHMAVHRLAGAVDHRYEQMRGTPNYFSPLGAEATGKLQAIFARITGGAPAKALDLPVQGRTVNVPRAGRDVAFFAFDELCSQPLAAADFLALAECFAVFLIDGVPQLEPERRNETVRFTTLIDALYEMKTKLFMAAAVAPEQLCPEGPLSFEFQRTASRLVEMQSEEYRQSAHLG